jgi:F420H(2)-dependent biliverdin reductase
MAASRTPLLSPTEQERLSTEANVWMATVRPDGRPHLVPIWFVWVKGQFWIATSPTAVKVNNVRASALMAVALEDGNQPLVAEGTVAIHDTLALVPSEVGSAFSKKYDWTLSEEAGGVCVIAMTPTKWMRPGGA